jgi:hypothetical protein
MCSILLNLKKKEDSKEEPNFGAQTIVRTTRLAPEEQQARLGQVIAIAKEGKVTLKSSEFLQNRTHENY